MYKPNIISYSLGFILSIVLTLGAYFLVANHGLNNSSLIAVIIFLAIIQLFVQLFFFLHVGREKSPLWNLVVLISTVSVILILLLGSLWIMSHLNYRMMPGPQMDQKIIQDEGMPTM